MRFMRLIVLGTVVLAILFVSNCGKDTGTNPQPTSLALNVDSVTVDVSSTFQFVATLNGDTVSAKWYVVGTLGGNPVFGMITQTGLFIAPPEPLAQGSRVEVTARAEEDTTLSASAIVTIEPVSYTHLTLPTKA